MRGGVRSYPTPPLVLVGLTNRAQGLLRLGSLSRAGKYRDKGKELGSFLGLILLQGLVLENF